MKIYDYIIIGSGISGLTFAIKMSKMNKSIIIITKSKLENSNSFKAQGGIASVLNKNVDSYDSHIQDTLTAGAGLCHLDTVKKCVKNGPRLIKELRDYGVNFEKLGNNLELGKEGGHSQRRVAHAGDITGEEIMKVLINKIKSLENIEIKEDNIAVDLITSHFKLSSQKYAMGAYVLDKKTEKIHRCLAKNTILATGGAGKVYLYTSNPDTATGDGIAMAYRAGAEIANMEFMQFHPTCLFHPEAKSFLISEALRGEGGILKLIDGNEFMQNYHHLKSLAPRDIVARAIDLEMKKSGAKHVYLDMRHLDSEFIKKRFPNIYEKTLSFGIDMTKEMIPVVPAAHYTCGGVIVDKNGESSIKHLFVIGEASCTGLHGANRLASNSLLEGLVYGEAAYLKSKDYFDDYQKFHKVTKWKTGNAVMSEEKVLISHAWNEIRTLMWNYVGIVRSNKRLNHALNRIKIIKEEINDYYWTYLISSDLIELKNIADIAELIILSARYRRESRGLHTTIDYENIDNENFLHDTPIRKKLI